MSYFFAALIGYAIGNIATAYIAGKLLKGIDIREYGSGNAGATNVFRTLGTKPGIAVFACDIAKGVIASLIGGWITGGSIIGIIIGGVFAVVGHNWPVVLGFKGGKGIATSIGLVVIIIPEITIILAVISITVILFTRYVSLGSITAAILLPVLLLLFNEPLEVKVFGILLSVFAIYKHRTNIVRLLKGQENKITLR